MNTRKQSQIQERKVAKEIGGKVTIASGAFWCNKGDVRSDKFLVECKTTKKPYYRLNFKLWDKIHKEALRDGLRIPVMCIELDGGKSTLAVLPVDLAPSITNDHVINCWGHKSIMLFKDTVLKVSFPPIAIFPWEEFLEIAEGIEII